jgi:putative ABC transport system permease protein
MWQVVGVFESQGNVFESEIWGDAQSVQRAFERGDTYQLVRAKLRDPAAFNGLAAALEADASLNLEARTESDYYSEQVDTVGAMALTMGVPLSFVMALGALVGAVNTMFGSVATRAREIATLRAMGFRRIAVFFATLAESLVIALGGAALALAIVYLVFDGFVGSTLGSSLTQVVFVFTLSGALIGQVAMCALLIGFGGGILPAQQAARAPIVSSMRG